jgi:nucleoside-diphosphate-sugar epimerase
MVRFYNKHFCSRYPAILFPLVLLAVWLRFVAMAGIRIFRPGHASRIRGTRRLFAEPPKNEPPVGVIGASSFLGQALIPLLKSKGSGVVAYSRQSRHSEDASLVWRNFEDGISESESGISSWVSLCPLPELVELLPKLTARGARRLVALSSTSRFTKIESADPAERRLAESLRESEAAVLKWGSNTGVEVVILRPTLIYDGVGDKNIAAIARFIHRWGWFPLLAPASGLRQPLHVSDAALACVEALRPTVPSGAYDLSGGETLSYRDMVLRIFAWEGVPRRIVELPPALVRLLRLLLRFRGLPADVFERMNKDLVFDHQRAAEWLGFAPRKFEPPVLENSPC